MANKRTYTDEQLAYIKQHWRKYPTKLVAEQLSMTSARVSSIASRHGLKKNLNKSRKPLPEFMTLQKAASKAMQDAIQAAQAGSLQSGVLGGSLGNIGAMHAMKNINHEYYQAIAAKHDALATGMYPSHDPEPFFGNPGHIYLHPQTKPRKNWLQRLVSWLLTGEA